MPEVVAGYSIIGDELLYRLVSKLPTIIKTYIFALYRVGKSNVN